MVILYVEAKMSKPEYRVYRCDADDDSPDTRVTIVTTKSLEEAQRIFEKESQHGLLDTKYVLEVSARGITAELESKTIDATVSENVWAYGVKKTVDKDEEKARFLDTVCMLHDAGFSAGEIADITGKTLRVIQYNQQKLKAEGRITSHGPGRLSDNTVREKRPVLIQLYTDSYDYLMERFGNVTNVVNDLVDKFRKELDENNKD